MEKISRRTFFKLTGVAIAAGTILHPRKSQAFTGKYASVIDLTRCDGCADQPIPSCVAACREQNRSRFPEPIREIQPYWPHKHYEDWSNKRDDIGTLQPYNWLYVQKVDLPERSYYIPRRCMHCDNPPCVSLCPFGAMSKEEAGNTVISETLCFGGAKCRDVCPWHIPQRQAGVGLYLKMMPKFAGGGVMYKCDLCKDRVREGKAPACVDACTARLKEKTAMLFGDREAIIKTAEDRSKSEDLHLYGLKENGGTATIYLSKVPFETIDSYLKTRKEKFQMPVAIKNPLNGAHKLAGYFAGGSIASAVIATAAAIFVRGKTLSKSDDNARSDHEDSI